MSDSDSFISEVSEEVRRELEAELGLGKGRMTVTGNLKDVMKESISAAASYVRSRSLAFGIKPPLFDRRDVHVHVPEGATPKDGPSAGIAMATAIISVMTGIPIRKDIAMTGEVTLRGALDGVEQTVTADTVVLACAPKGAPVYAISLGGNGKLPDSALPWISEGKEVNSDVPTPLYYKGRFYILNDRNKFLSCVEPGTGTASK